MLNEFDQDNDFDPRSFENNDIFPNSNGTASSPPLSTFFRFFSFISMFFFSLVAPPPKAARRLNLNNNETNAAKSSGQDLFGSAPFSPLDDSSPNR